MTKGKQAQRHIVVPFLPCDLLTLVRRNDRRRLSVLSNIRRIAPCDVLKAESKRLYPFGPVLSGALQTFAAFAELAAASKISCVTLVPSLYVQSLRGYSVAHVLPPPRTSPSNIAKPTSDRGSWNIKMKNARPFPGLLLRPLP